MADIVYLAVIVAFFALCVAFVRACDRIIGPDELAPLIPADGDDAGASEVAA